MSGEDPRVRPAIDRMTKQLTQGGMSESQARDIARNQAIKHEQREKQKKQ